MRKKKKKRMRGRQASLSFEVPLSAFAQLSIFFMGILAGFYVVHKIHCSPRFYFFPFFFLCYENAEFHSCISPFLSFFFLPSPSPFLYMLQMNLIKWSSEHFWSFKIYPSNTHVFIKFVKTVQRWKFVKRSNKCGIIGFDRIFF